MAASFIRCWALDCWQLDRDGKRLEGWHMSGRPLLHTFWQLNY